MILAFQLFTFIAIFYQNVVSFRYSYNNIATRKSFKLMDIKKGSQPPIDVTTTDQSRHNKSGTKINTKRTKSSKSSSTSTQRTNKIELYREVESFSLADTFNSTTIRLFLSLGDQFASNLGKVENILSSWQLILKSKIERDIKLTEKFGQYITRRASKGFGSVASTSADSFSKTFNNETSQTWGLMRLGINPFDATSLMFRGGGGRSKFVGGFDATTSTKQKIKRTKKRQNEAKGSVIPLLPSSIYNTVRTLPNKLQYDYQRRVVARETKRNLDLYDTQQQYILPTSTSGATSRNRDSRFMDDESSATSLRNTYYDGDEMFADEGDDDSDFVEDYNTVSSEELFQLSRVRLQAELDTINQLLSMPLKQFIDIVLDDDDSHSLRTLKQEFEWTLQLTEEYLEEKIQERETVQASLLELQSQQLQQQQGDSTFEQGYLESTDASSPSTTSVTESNNNDNDNFDSETTSTTSVYNQQHERQQQVNQDDEIALLLSQLANIDIDIDALLAAKSLLQQATDTTVNFSTLRAQVYNEVVQNIDPSILFNTQSNEVTSVHSTTDDNSLINFTVDDSNDSSTPDSSVTSSDMGNAENINNNTTNSNTSVFADSIPSSSPPSPKSTVTLSLDINQLVIVKEALNSILLSWNQVVVSSDNTSDSTTSITNDISSTTVTVSSTNNDSVNSSQEITTPIMNVSTITTSVAADTITSGNAALVDNAASKTIGSSNSVINNNDDNTNNNDNLSDIKNRIKRNKIVFSHVFEALNTVISTEKDKNKRLLTFLRQNKDVLQTMQDTNSDIDTDTKQSGDMNSNNSGQTSSVNNNNNNSTIDVVDILTEEKNDLPTETHIDIDIDVDHKTSVITDIESTIKIAQDVQSSVTTATNDDDYEIEIDIYGDVTYIPRRNSNNSTKTKVSTAISVEINPLSDDFVTTAIDPIVTDTDILQSSRMSSETTTTLFNTSIPSTADSYTNNTPFTPMDFNDFNKNTYKTKILNNNNIVFVLDKLPLLTVQNVVNLYTDPIYQEMLLKSDDNNVYYTSDDDYIKERNYDSNNNNNNGSRNSNGGGVILDAAAGDVTINETKEKQLAQFILVSLDVTLFLLESLVRAVVPVLSGTAGNMLTNAQSALELGQPSVKELVIIWNKYDKISFYIPSSSATTDKATVLQQSSPSLATSTTVPGSISINKVTTNSLIDVKNALLFLFAFEKQIELRNKLRTVPQSWKAVVRYEVVDIIATNNNKNG